MLKCTQAENSLDHGNWLKELLVGSGWAKRLNTAKEEEVEQIYDDVYQDLDDTDNEEGTVKNEIVF